MRCYAFIFWFWLSQFRGGLQREWERPWGNSGVLVDFWSLLDIWYWIFGIGYLVLDIWYWVFGYWVFMDIGCWILPAFLYGLL